MKIINTFILLCLLLLGGIQSIDAQISDSLDKDVKQAKTLLSELGFGYANTLSGRQGDIVIQYNIGYKRNIIKHLKFNAMAFLEGINTGRTLINFGPKIGLQYNFYDDWKIAARMGIGLLNNQDQRPGTISWEVNIGLEDQLAIFTKYNKYNTDGYANGEYLSFGLQMEGMRSLKTTAIVGSTTGLVAIILSAIISRSR